MNVLSELRSFMEGFPLSKSTRCLYYNSFKKFIDEESNLIFFQWPKTPVFLENVTILPGTDNTLLYIVRVVK